MPMVVRKRSKSRAELLEIAVRREVEHDPHEEFAGLPVVELLGFQDIPAALEQKASHARHDARAVRTGQGEDVPSIRLSVHRDLLISAAGLRSLSLCTSLPAQAIRDNRMPIVLHFSIQYVL